MVLNGFLSPLSFPLLVGAWRVFDSLSGFCWSGFVHEVGPCRGTREL